MKTRMLTRKTLLLASVATGIATLCGCAQQDGEQAQASASQPSKPAILVVSFGTSYASSRHITIGAIESDIREAYPDYDVRRAFTSQIIIDHIESDTGRHIDNVEEALDKLVADGVRDLCVQPTHLMDGFEYQDIEATLETYRDKFANIWLGAPLLASKTDQEEVARAVKAAMEPYEGEGVAICLMGHGTEAESNSVYGKMQECLASLGYDNYFITTVEASPTFADTTKAVKDAGFTSCVLRPFMVVAGDHATNDMADTSDPESLASTMEAAGLEVTSVIEGLGQLDAIDDIYVRHVAEAMGA